MSVYLFRWEWGRGLDDQYSYTQPNLDAKREVTQYPGDHHTNDDGIANDSQSDEKTGS